MKVNIEKYKSIFHDFSYSYLTVFVQRVLGIVTTYFLIRAFTEEQFSEYTIILTYISLFTALSLPQLGNVVMQSTARKNTSFFRKARGTMLRGSIIAGVILLVIGIIHLFIEKYDNILGYGLIAAAILFPLYRGLTLWKNKKSGEKKFKELSILNNTIQILTNIAMLILITQVKVSDYIPLIIAYLLIPTLFNVVLSITNADPKPEEEENDNKESDKELMDYGLKTSFYAILHTISQKLDHFILFYFLAPETLAFYAIANRIPEMLRQVTQTLCSVLAPRFAVREKYTNEVKKPIRLYGIAFGAFIIAITFTIYPHIMLWLFSEKYQDSIFYSQIIMMSLVIATFANLKFRFIRSHKDSESYKKVMLTISLVRICCVVALVPLLGVWGAVIALIAYRLTMMVIVELIIRDKYLETQ